MQDNFFGSAVDAVPPAHPLHLISGFKCFGHAFLAHHLCFNDFQPVFADGVDLRQMGKEFFCKQQGTVKDRTVLLQIGTTHPSILADVVLLRVSQYEVGNQVVPALCVGQLHSGLLCGNVWG